MQALKLERLRVKFQLSRCTVYRSSVLIRVEQATVARTSDLKFYFSSQQMFNRGQRIAAHHLGIQGARRKEALPCNVTITTHGLQDAKMVERRLTSPISHCLLPIWSTGQNQSHGPEYLKGRESMPFHTYPVSEEECVWLNNSTTASITICGTTGRSLSSFKVLAGPTDQVSIKLKEDPAACTTTHQRAPGFSLTFNAISELAQFTRLGLCPGPSFLLGPVLLSCLIFWPPP